MATGYFAMVAKMSFVNTSCPAQRFNVLKDPLVKKSRPRHRLAGRRRPRPRQYPISPQCELRRSSIIRFTAILASATDILGSLLGFAVRYASTFRCQAGESNDLELAAKRCQSRSKAACCCSGFNASINASSSMDVVRCVILTQVIAGVDALSRQIQWTNFFLIGIDLNAVDRTHAVDHARWPGPLVE
ncbi:MAG: hypothetical protein RLY70_2155 [Planctomycetota bacterium]